MFPNQMEKLILVMMVSTKSLKKRQDHLLEIFYTVTSSTVHYHITGYLGLMVFAWKKTKLNYKEIQRRKKDGCS